MTRLADHVDFVLTLDSAQPLSPSLIGELTGLCDRIEDADGDAVAVILINGSSGPVPEQWPGGVQIHLVSKWEQALRRLERLSALSIAVVDGHCSGLTLELLLSCDHRIATPSARLDLPLTAEGVWPGMVLHRLATHLGVARARQLLLFKTSLDAGRAADLGLVDQVTDDPIALVAQQEAALRGLAGSELAIRRRLLMDAAVMSFEDALGAHLAACDRALRRMNA